MKLLPDTHALLWWFADDRHVSATCRRLIADPANEVLLSAASVLEIVTKHRLGKLPEAGDLLERLEHYIDQSRLVRLSISTRHAHLAAALTIDHRDPFDRLLIAQGLIEQIPILTVDPVLKAAGVEVIW